MDSQGIGRHEGQEANTSGLQGLDLCSSPEVGGADVRGTEAGRGREVPPEGKTPRGCQGPRRILRKEKGRQTDEVHGNQRNKVQDSRGQ